MFHKALVKLTAKMPIINRHWSKALESEKIYRLPPEQLQAQVQERLTRLLRRAAKSVPCYRQIFQEHGWDAARAEAYWDQWPILTQQQLQEHRDELIADDVNKNELILDSSGGSSGFTKTFYHSQAYRFSAAPAVYWADHLAGWYPGVSTARLWGAQRDLPGTMSLIKKVRCWLRNERLYNSFDMDDKIMWTYHEDMERFEADILIAYAGSAFQFARFLKRNNLEPNYPRVGIITSAELLTNAMRDEIQAVFRKPAFDRYGSREVGVIACECEAHSGLHMANLHNFIEVVRPGSVEPEWNQQGNVLVTTLGETDAPVLRYEIGDMAVVSRQRCSYQNPLRGMKWYIEN